MCVYIDGERDTYTYRYRWAAREKESARERARARERERESEREREREGGIVGCTKEVLQTFSMTPSLLDSGAPHSLGDGQVMSLTSGVGSQLLGGFNEDAYEERSVLEWGLHGYPIT